MTLMTGSLSWELVLVARPSMRITQNEAIRRRHIDFLQTLKTEVMFTGPM
jgi:hypothetical protein